MFRIIRLSVMIALLVCLLPMGTAAAQDELPPGICTDETQENGAIYRVCMPTSAWNGDLVIYAHGYVSPYAEIAIPEDQMSLPDGTYVPFKINEMGYAFATTSYPTNGLAVLDAIQDIRALRTYFKRTQGTPAHIYLIGVSEGGLITTLSIERYPREFSGGMAACGPVGDFNRQINYWGDFRLLFDYFFPTLLPPEPFAVPDELIAFWEQPIPNVGLSYQQMVGAALLNDMTYNGGLATQQLLATARAPVDPADPNSIGETILGLLWYNVNATNEGLVRLNGNPYDNRYRRYSGSLDDLTLNATITRFTPDIPALKTIASYQTSGRLSRPLVTLHTTGDPIVPYWHETLYRSKTILRGSWYRHVNIPIARYGHCNFEVNELLGGFAVLSFMTTGRLPAGLNSATMNDEQREKMDGLIREYRTPRR